MIFLFRQNTIFTALQSYNLKAYVMSHLSCKIGTIVRDFSKQTSFLIAENSLCTPVPLFDINQINGTHREIFVSGMMVIGG